MRFLSIFVGFSYVFVVFCQLSYFTTPFKPNDVIALELYSYEGDDLLSGRFYPVRLAKVLSDNSSNWMRFELPRPCFQIYEEKSAGIVHRGGHFGIGANTVDLACVGNSTFYKKDIYFAHLSSNALSASNFVYVFQGNVDLGSGNSSLAIYNYPARGGVLTSSASNISLAIGSSVPGIFIRRVSYSHVAGASGAYHVVGTSSSVTLNQQTILDSGEFIGMKHYALDAGKDITISTYYRESLTQSTNVGYLFESQNRMVAFLSGETHVTEATLCNYSTGTDAYLWISTSHTSEATGGSAGARLTEYRLTHALRSQAFVLTSATKTNRFIDMAANSVNCYQEGSSYYLYIASSTVTGVNAAYRVNINTPTVRATAISIPFSNSMYGSSSSGVGTSIRSVVKVPGFLTYPTPSVSTTSTSSPSVSVSNSPTRSSSGSNSPTGTPSASSTGTLTGTATSSHTASTSPTPTTTLSVGVSPSNTPSASSTVSITGTPTPTTTVTSSQTPTGTATATLSLGASPSITPSVSPTSSNTPSISASNTPPFDLERFLRTVSSNDEGTTVIIAVVVVVVVLCVGALAFRVRQVKANRGRLEKMMSHNSTNRGGAEDTVIYQVQMKPQARGSFGGTTLGGGNPRSYSSGPTRASNPPLKSWV